jgi:hypothetical protein
MMTKTKITTMNRIFNLSTMKRRSSMMTTTMKSKKQKKKQKKKKIFPTVPLLRLRCRRKPTHRSLTDRSKARTLSKVPTSKEVATLKSVNNPSTRRRLTTNREEKRSELLLVPPGDALRSAAVLFSSLLELVSSLAFSFRMKMTTLLLELALRPVRRRLVLQR